MTTAIIKLFGPPGTGKTTSLVRDFLLNYDPESVAVVSLTRATRKAFLEKCWGLKAPVKSQNVRTMHSWCWNAFKNTNGKKGILETNLDLVNKFLSYYHFEEVRDRSLFDAESLLFEEYSKEQGVAIIQALAKVRTTWDCTLPWKEHFKRFVIEEGEEFGVPDVSLFWKIFTSYHQFKRENDVIDFTDLLILALQRKIDPFETMKKKELLICDEFQDLYPLAVRVFQLYVKNFQDVIIAGDDDQTIFAFTGANPKYFLNDLQGKEVVLKQSYRLPYEIWKYALRIIEKNKMRKVKLFKPTQEKGKVETIWQKDVLDLLEESAEKRIDTLLLVRTNYHIKQYVEVLEDWDIPYGLALKNVASEKMLKILETHEKLCKGEPVLDGYLNLFCEEIVYSYVRQRTGRKRLMKDEKEKIQKALKERDPFKAKEFSTAIREIFTKELEEISGYEKELVKKWKVRLKRIDEWLNPKLKVMTVHSAKGLEADKVIVDPRITTKIENSMETQEGLESERRVWYTAVTRAKKELYVIETHEKAFPLPLI